MDISANEMETVMEYWQDISQDPQYISKELNMNIKKVSQILHKLQNNGDIEGYLIDESIVDPETSKILNLSQFSSKDDNKYFFTKKKIDMCYDKFTFLIEAKSMEIIDNNTAVIINCVVTIKNKDFDFFIYYNKKDEVFYGSHDGQEVVENIRESLGDNMEDFDNMTAKVLHDALPEDFWEVRDSKNSVKN